MIAHKQLRRVLVGRCLSFLFEDRQTVQYQVQEIAYAEGLTCAHRINTELARYNTLLGGPGELGCTLFVELTDPADPLCHPTALSELSAQVYVKTTLGIVHPVPVHPGAWPGDPVQFLKFKIGMGTPLAVGVDHTLLRAETRLTLQQQRTLCASPLEPRVSLEAADQRLRQSNGVLS